MTDPNAILTLSLWDDRSHVDGRDADLKISTATEGQFEIVHSAAGYDSVVISSAQALALSKFLASNVVGGGHVLHD